VSLDLTDLIPFDNVPPSPTADQTVHIALRRHGHAWAWTLNGV